MTQLYKIYDEKDVLLYVGIGEDADKRVRSHREKWWGHEIARYEIDEVGPRDAAISIEAATIVALSPKYNRTHNDGSATTPTLTGVVRRRARLHGETRLISIQEAAGLLSVTERTIRNYIARGDLSASRLGARTIRVKHDDVLALLTPIPTVIGGAAVQR